MSMSKSKKSSLGRQKIPIEKIPKKSHLQVTFSKRRSGLFKKASELCTLCGVEIAIVVFSPADKAFSFGHPEVESLIDRYTARNHPPESSSSSGAHHLVEAHRNANVRDLNMQLTQLLSQLEMEKKRGEDLEQERKTRQRQLWWESPVDELALHELAQLKLSIEDLKNNIHKHATKFMLDSSSSSSSSSPLLGGPNTSLGPLPRYDSSSLHPNPHYHLAFPTPYL